MATIAPQQEPLHKEWEALYQAVSAYRTAVRAGDIDRAAAAAAAYQDAATILFNHGVTIWDVDPMALLPDEVLPICWHDADFPLHTTAFTTSTASSRH